jgi:hypothetical protein
LSRPLPFANDIEEKTVIVGLLQDQSLQVRREVETLLRLYPHDDFATVFDKMADVIDAHPETYSQTIVPAVVSYYYNRIIEQGWAETVEKATSITAELSKGLKWAGRLPLSDRATARARLLYAKANALVQITGDKAPSVDVANQIKGSFLELLKLSPDDLAAYPYPHHLARALAYTSGSAEDAKHFETYSIDGFQRVTPPKSTNLELVNYELGLRVLPDPKSTQVRQFVAGESARILMTLGGDSQGAAWQFVITSRGAGWIKYKAPVTVTGELHLRQHADPQAPDVVGRDYRIPEGSQVTITQKCEVWMGSGRGAQDADNVWCPVQYGNYKGWANALLLAGSDGRRVACEMYPNANKCPK